MKKTIQDYKKESTLNKIFRYPEGVMSRKEWLNMQRIKGWSVEEKEVRNYAAEEKLRDSVEWQKKNVPLGNPNYPSTAAYLEDKKRLEAGIFKTEYRLIKDNSIYDITKTEYEYFKNMELAEDINTQKMELTYKIEAEIATPEEIEQDEQQDIEFFKKYTK